MPWGGDRERKCALPVCLPACLPPAACPPACLPFALPSLGFPCVTNITPAMSRTCYFRRPGSFSDFLLATVYILDPCSSVNSAAFYSRNPCLALKRNVSHEVCLVCCWLAVLHAGLNRHLRLPSPLRCPAPPATLSSRCALSLPLLSFLTVSSSLLLLLLSGSCSLSICFASSCLRRSPCLILRLVSLSFLPLRLSSCRLSSRSIPSPHLPVCATVVFLLLVLPSVTVGPPPPSSSLPSPDVRLVSLSLRSLSSAFLSCARSCSLPVQHAVFVVCVPVVLLPSSVAPLVLPFLRSAPAAAAAFLVSLPPMSGLPLLPLSSRLALCL